MTPRIQNLLSRLTIRICGRCKHYHSRGVLYITKHYSTERKSSVLTPRRGVHAPKTVAPPLSESTPAVPSWAPSVACWMPSITFRHFFVFLLVVLYIFPFLFLKIFLPLFASLWGIYTLIVSVLPPGMLEWKHTLLEVEISINKYVYIKVYIVPYMNL